MPATLPSVPVTETPVAGVSVASGRGRLAGTGLQLGAGLVTVGAAGYVFLAVAGNTLSSADYAALAMLYLLINIIGPGLFIALEQETSRAMSARVAAGVPTGPTARAAALLALGLFGILAVVVLAVSPVLTDRLFNGNPWLLVALLLGGVGAAAVFWARGILGGQRQFGGYAVTILGEGLARLLPTLLLPLMGLAAATGLGFSFAAGTVIATAVTAPWLHRGGPGPHEELPPMARGMALLVAATLLSQLVANFGPVVVGLRSSDVALVATFASAVVLARIPLFLFSPVQMLLLPGLTRAAEVGDRRAVAIRIRQLLMAVAAFGLAAVAVTALVGPHAVQVFFGAGVALPAAVLALLAASSVLFMAAYVLQPALIALRRHRWVAIGWVAGAVVFLAVAAAPGSPVRAVVVAQLAGPAVVIAVMGAGLVRALRGHARAPDQASVR